MKYFELDKEEKKLLEEFERGEKGELTSSEDAAAFLICLVKTPKDVPNFSVSAPISRKVDKI